MEYQPPFPGQLFCTTEGFEFAVGLAGAGIILRTRTGLSQGIGSIA